MSNHDDITGIRLRLLEEWGDLTPVIISGEPASDQPDVAYIRISVMPNIEDRVSLGANPQHEVRGIVWIDIFAPSNEGDAQAWSLADRAASIFRDWRSEDGRIFIHRVSYRQGADDGLMMRVIIEAQYRARHS